MKGPDERHLVLLYIYLAGGVAVIGTGLTFALLALCAYYNIDITRNWWLLATPAAAALFINVFLIEIYRKLTKR